MSKISGGRKLVLHRETVTSLTDEQLVTVVGGTTGIFTCYATCNCTCSGSGGGGGGGSKVLVCPTGDDGN